MVNVQNIVCRYVEEYTEFAQMPYWQLVCAAFISCIHGLRSSKHVRYLLLGQVVVLSKLTKLLAIVFHTITPFFVISPFYLLCKKGIDFSKYLYYNYYADIEQRQSSCILSCPMVYAVLRLNSYSAMKEVDCYEKIYMYYTETITISLNAEEVEELTIKVMSTYIGGRDEW